MGNIFYFAGKSYYISKEEQEEFTFEFGIGCLYVGEQLHLEWHNNADKPTINLSKIIEINSIKFNDEYHKAKNIKEKYNEFLKSNVIFSDEKNYVEVFGNWPMNFSRSGEGVSFEKSVKEEQLRKIIMPISEVDWQEFLCNNEMKNGMIGYLDKCFMIVENDNITEDEDKIVDLNSSTRIKVKRKSKDKDKDELSDNSGNLEHLAQVESEKKLLENQKYLNKEKRRFVFLNSKLHLLDSLGIDEYFFEGLNLNLQRRILNLCIVYGREPLKFFNVVTSNNNISLEKKLEFVVKVLNEYDSKNENATNVLNFLDVQRIIFNEIKNDKEILKQTVNKLVYDNLGITYCDFIQSLEERELKNILDFCTTNTGLCYLKNKIFSKLNIRLIWMFMKNFDFEKFKSFSDDYFSFLVENELLQNYLITNSDSDKFFMLQKFYFRAKSHGNFLKGFSIIINDYSINFEDRMKFAEIIVGKFESCEEKLKEKNMSLWEIICNEKDDDGNEIESDLKILKLIINKLVSDYLGVADCDKFLNQEYEKKDLKSVLELFTTVDSNFYLSKEINLDKKNNLEEEFNFDNDNDLDLAIFLLKSEKEKIKKYCLDINLEIELSRYLSYEQLIELHNNFSENPQIIRNEIFDKLSLPLKVIYLKTSQEQRVIFDTLNIGFLNLIDANRVLQTYLITYPDKLSVLLNFYQSTHYNEIALELFNIVMDSDNIYFYERIDFLKKVLDEFQLIEEDSPQTNAQKVIIICDEIKNNQEILKLTVYRFVSDNLGVAAFNFVRELETKDLKNILDWFTTIDTTFYKLNPNLKFVFLKSFVKGNQEILNKFSNDFFNLLITNEKLQNFSMLYPNEIDTLIEIYQSTPHFLEIEPLSRVIMFFKACKDFDWKDDIREKFCSVVDDRLLQDKNLISFLAKCQNEKQMRVICEIYHYGGNKINGKFGINEINHFEVVCKMLEDFSPDDETYNFYRMNLAKLYANAEKIGLFKNKFLYVDGVLKFRSDDIFLLEVSRCPDIVDKLISGELSFENAEKNVLSNDFLLFGWIEHANLKFNDYKLYLVQSLFFSFQDIFENTTGGDEHYNVVNNIYELRKFVCNLSDNFNLSSENFVEFVEKLRKVVKIPGALSKLNVKGNNIETVQSAIKILNNDLDTQETSNDLETRVNLINYYNDQFVNEPYWYQSYLISIDYTIFNLDSKNIEDELDKNLITIEGTLSERIKIVSNYLDSIFLKFLDQKAIYDSENLDIRLENLTFLYDQRLKLLKKNIRLNDDQNIQEKIDSLKKYFTTDDLSDLDLGYINSLNDMGNIKNDLGIILKKLSLYKSNGIKNLCTCIKEYLYTCILLHKVLIPKAKMMIEEKNKAKIDEINLTAISQILNEKINFRNERKYIFNKLPDLNENNMRCIKDLLVENPDNIILIVRLFNIIDTTKDKMIEKKDRINISLKPMDNLDNDQSTFIKTDINNMFGLFKYKTFSFLNSNPDITEFILGLNCVNVDLLNVDILKRIKQLQGFCSGQFLTVYVRAVLNAVDYVEQDKQEVMLRLLNRSYINFVANKNVFGVLSQDPYLGIVMNYLPSKVNIIFKIMQDNNAIDLLEKICFYSNDIYFICNHLNGLFTVYELYPEEIKQNMTVKELQNIDLDELRYRKQYEKILKRSTQVKWYQSSRTPEQEQAAIENTISLCINNIAGISDKTEKKLCKTALYNATILFVDKVEQADNCFINAFSKLCEKVFSNIVKNYDPNSKSFEQFEDEIQSAIDSLEDMINLMPESVQKSCEDKLAIKKTLVLSQEVTKVNKSIDDFEMQCQEDFNMSVLPKWYQSPKTYEQKRQAIASTTDLFVQKINNMPDGFVKTQYLQALIHTKDSVVMQEAEKMSREVESSNRAADQAR